MSQPRVLILAALVLSSSIVLRAECPNDVVIMKGRVDHVPRNAVVRIQLLYAKQKDDSSGEINVEHVEEDGPFRIQIRFNTESQAPWLYGNFGEKCDRRPTSVTLTLLKKDNEVDQVSLNFSKDFEMTDASAYTFRSEVTLHGEH